MQHKNSWVPAVCVNESQQVFTSLYEGFVTSQVIFNLNFNIINSKIPKPKVLTVDERLICIDKTTIRHL